MRVLLLAVGALAAASLVTADEHHHDEPAFSAEQALSGVMTYVNRRQPEKGLAFAEYALQHYPLDIELNLLYLDIADEEELSDVARGFYHGGPGPDGETALTLVIAGRLAENVEDAMAAFDRALALDPTFAAAHYGKALATYRQGDLELALRELSAALAAAPGDRRALALRGQINWAQGRADEAREGLEAATKDGFYAPQALMTLGRIYKDEGRAKEAREVVRAAIGQSPSRGEYYFELGQVLEMTSENGAALLAYEAAAARTADANLSEAAAAAIERLSASRAP